MPAVGRRPPAAGGDATATGSAATGSGRTGSAGCGWTGCGWTGCGSTGSEPTGTGSAKAFSVAGDGETTTGGTTTGGATTGGATTGGTTTGGTPTGGATTGGTPTAGATTGGATTGGTTGPPNLGRVGSGGSGGAASTAALTTASAATGGGGSGRAASRRGIGVDPRDPVRRRPGQGEHPRPEERVVARKETGLAGGQLVGRDQAGGDAVLGHLGRRPRPGMAQHDLGGEGVVADAGEQQHQDGVVVLRPVDGGDVVGEQVEDAVDVDHHVGRRRAARPWPAPRPRPPRCGARRCRRRGPGSSPCAVDRYQPRLPLGWRGAWGFWRSSR